MTDIATVWDPVNRRFDWSLENEGAGPSLLQDDGLDTAVILSLFTDRRADDDDILPDDAVGPLGQGKKGSGDRRAWFGDFLTPAALAILSGQSYPKPAWRLGSHLWLFRRRKMIPGLAAEVADAVSEALDWMLQDGIATAIGVTGTASDGQTVTVTGSITLASGLALPLEFAVPVGIGL